MGEAERVRSSRSRRDRFRRAWALGWGIILALVFVAVTALTVALWFADPAGAETNPVVDVAFLFVGGSISLGFLAQVRRPERWVAGVQQAVVGSAALALAGAVGARIEPLVGGLGLLAASLVLAAAHPVPLWEADLDLDRRLLALSAVGALPGIAVAIVATRLALDAGPSCFLGQCATGDRYAELAALAIAVPTLVALAVRRPSGWRLPLRTATLAALAVGVASVLLPAVDGSLGVAGGAAAAAWGAFGLAFGRCLPPSPPGP